MATLGKFFGSVKGISRCQLSLPRPVSDNRIIRCWKGGLSCSSDFSPLSLSPHHVTMRHCMSRGQLGRHVILELESVLSGRMLAFLRSRSDLRVCF